MRVIELTLPLPENRGNARWHWRTEHRKKKNYHLLCTGADVGKRPTEPFAKARITVTFYLWSEMDVDNVMARMKWPLDWLKQRGIITDDNRKHLEWAGLPEQVIDRKNQRLEIRIEEL